MNYSRRTFIKRSSLTLAGLSMAQSSLLASAGISDLPYKMTALRQNVGYFTERGGTIGWMISNDGIVVVDTQFPAQSEHLVEAIKKQSERKIDLLINTHHHGDHSSGNIAYKGIANMILAHENSKKNQERVAKEKGQESDQLYPDTTFQDKWSKKIDKETITLRYFGPAHTDGDAIIHFENANIVHMGDLVFNRRFPYIDRSSGASISNWIQVLEKTHHQFDGDTLFIFGHAGDGYEVIGKLEDIQAKRMYLEQLLDFVKKEIADGKKEDEILKNTMVPGASGWQGGGIERNLKAAYEELTL